MLTRRRKSRGSVLISTYCVTNNEIQTEPPAEARGRSKCEKLSVREIVREMDMSTTVMQEMSGAKLDVAWVREQFPSLKEQVAGVPAAFLDGPAGTQVPRQVMNAITNYLTHANANRYGKFATSRRTNE